MSEALAKAPTAVPVPARATVENVDLRGAEKGLILLVSLEEAVATKVLSHLTQVEVKALRSAAETLKDGDPKVVQMVYRDFAEAIQHGMPSSLKGSGAYLRRLVGKALGEGLAAEVWRDEKQPEGSVAALASLDVPTILGILEREHAQTIAVILSQLGSGRGAEILGAMPTERQAEIMHRLAQLESIPTAVIDEIDRQFAMELETMDEAGRCDVDGVEAASDLLKRLDGERGEALMEELSALDPTLADKLRRSRFTVPDLVRMDARGMQLLLKEVSTDQLVLALKTASEEIREKVFGSVSSRAAAVLKDELEMLGPVRVSEVEEAQQAIVEQALALERDGRIDIAREGGNDYV